MISQQELDRFFGDVEDPKKRFEKLVDAALTTRIGLRDGERKPITEELCGPCLARGKRRRAVNMVAGEGFCSRCFKE